MTRASARHARLLLSALCLGAALAAGSAQAAPTDLGPHGGPHAVLTCPPTVGGEVNVLCAPRPAHDPCSDHPGRCRIEE